MTASYTFDVFSSIDGFGAASGNWTGYWGKQCPELLEHRLALYSAEQRLVLGANTYRAFAQMLATSTEDSDVRDPWVTRMRNLPNGGDIGIGAGDVGGQALRLGLVDKVAMDIVPVVFGRGKPYFGSFADAQLMLADPDVVLQGKGVLHLIYPVRPATAA